MNAGVSMPRLRKRFPSAGWTALEDLLPKFLFGGLLVATVEGRISLTPRGRLLADSIGAEILVAFESGAKVVVK